MAKFTVFYNNEIIKTYELNEPVIFIGRLPENLISIANMGVSRRHSKIEEDADHRYMISDLNSLNGTYVNNKKVKKQHLVHNDKITIGKYTIIYEETDINTSEHEELLHQPISEVHAASELIVPQDEYHHDEPMDDDLPTEKENSKSTIKLQTDELRESDDIEDAIPVESHLDNSSDISINSEMFLKNQNQETGAILIETNKHVIYKMDKPLLTIGNGDNDDIFVSGFMIGEGQVTIEKQDEGFFISGNKLIGKFKVNGKATKSHILQHKDRIEIGSSTFRFMENG
jgi:pSer/pThr/pTyr-binding forkhead associated (FHA) protein